MRRSGGMPRWSNRHVLRSPRRTAGFLVTMPAALLLLVAGQGVLADDEPAARALLPPPLQSVPAENRQGSEPPTGKDQSGTRQSASQPDGSKTASSQAQRRLHSTPSRAVGRAIGNKAPARRGSHLASASAHRQGRRSISSEVGQTPGPRIGQLSPPSGFAPRADRPPGPIMEPPRDPHLYYPGYFAGPPAYGYAPRYPYVWEPSEPGVFR